MLSTFSYVSGPSVCPPWRSVCSGPLPTFKFDCLSFWCGVVWVLYIFWRSNPCPRYHWQIHFPYSWFSFHFADVFLSHAEAFYFEEVPFVYSFLYVPCFRGHISENIIAWNILRLSCLCSPLGLLWRLIFKSFIHLEFILMYGVSWWSSFFSFLFLSFTCSCPDLPAPFIEEAIFTPFCAPAPFVEY